jgi:hypothetical protein
MNQPLPLQRARTRLGLRGALSRAPLQPDVGLRRGQLITFKDTHALKDGCENHKSRNKRLFHSYHHRFLHASRIITQQA